MRISDWSSDVCSSDLVDDKIANGDRALAFEIGRAGFERQHVRLLKPQFGRILDRDHAFARIDHFGQRVEHGRLARTRTAGNDDIEPASASDLERSEEHTSELKSLMRISYAVFCLTNKITK